MQHSDSGSFSMKQQQQPTALRHSTSSAAPSSDDHLFHTPSDLVCPITLSLFQDPVCNAVGQVYERAALQRHLLQAAVSGQPPTDPVSNAVLPSLDLVPVWPMRSRAAEYRDSTIRACVHSAAAPDCVDPVKYLRRASELVLSTDPAVKSSSSRLSSSTSSGGLTPAHSITAAASPRLSRSPASTASPAVNASPDAPGSEAATGAKPAADRSPAQAAAVPAEASSTGVGSVGVPGLTVEFAQYLSAHQGRQYDALVLKYFGNELLRAGCPDAASNVFYRLLLEAEDRVQQAEYLQLCLDCWTASSCTADDGDGSGSLTATKPAVQQQQAGAPPEAVGQAAPGPVSGAIINKLADFVQRQRCLSPRAIVQMLQSTHHGSAMAMQLCQVLLLRAASAAAAAGPAGSAEAVLGLPGGLGGVLEVLLELVDLGHGQLLEEVEQLTHQVQQLEAAQAQQQQHQAGSGNAEAASADGGEPVAAAPTSLQQQAAHSSEAADATAKRSRRSKGHSWRGGKGVDVLMGRMVRVAAAGTLAVATLAQGNHPMLRLARLGPLLYLLRSGL